MKIYESNAGGLYPQPGRTVTTFPSGLIRVDQSYACADSSVAAIRSTLAVGNSIPDYDASPSIDDYLSIFPAVQENRRGDGFTEFKVSAYGRVANTLQTITQTPVTVTFNSVLTYKLWSIAGSIAIPSGTVLEYDDLDLDPTLLDPFDFESIAAQLIVLDANIIEEYLRGEVTDAGLVVTRAYKLWQIRFTEDGISTHSTYNVQVFYPSIAVKSYRHFGAFVEIDVETSILNTTTDITPAP